MYPIEGQARLLDRIERGVRKLHENGRRALRGKKLQIFFNFQVVRGGKGRRGGVVKEAVMPCFQGRAEVGPRSSALHHERLNECEKLPTCCGKLVLGLKPLHSRHKKGSKSLIVIKS